MKTLEKMSFSQNAQQIISYTFYILFAGYSIYKIIQTEFISTKILFIILLIIILGISLYSEYLKHLYRKAIKTIAYEFQEENEDIAYTTFLNSKTNEELVAMLKEKDEKALEKIHPNNRKRLIRALQICHSGTSKSEQEDKQQHIPLYDVYFLGLDVNREILHDRINKRVDIMFENGLVKEVEDLFTNPETWEYTSFQGIGYKEFKDYFLKEKSIDEVKTAIKTHSRQYAKRQYTWFKNQMPVHWFEAQNRDEIYSAVKEWLMDEDK